MSIDRPHLAFPNLLASVEQDSIAHIEQRCLLLMSIPLGSLIDRKDFGIPGQAFTRQGVGLEEIRAALARWVPVADTLVTDEAIVGWARRIKITVHVNAQEG